MEVLKQVLLGCLDPNNIETSAMGDEGCIKGRCGVVHDSLEQPCIIALRGVLEAGIGTMRSDMISEPVAAVS